MEVYLSELTEHQLKRLTQYVLEEWNDKVNKDVLAKLTVKIEQISINPESGQKSTEFGGIYKCVVIKQSTFF